MSVIGLIARREMTERLRAKSFYILTGLLVAVVLGAGVVGRFAASDDDTSTLEVAVVADAGGDVLGESIRNAASGLGLEATVTPIDDAEAAQRALEDGDVAAVVLVDERQVVFESEVDDRAYAVLQQAWSNSRVEEALADAGLSAEQLDAALRPPPLDATVVDEEDDSPDGIAVLSGTATAILLFISLQTFGGYVLIGVVEEKATAVVEVLLVRVRADQLLAGKVIGIGVVALAQFAVAVLAGVVALAISGVDVPVEVFGALPISLVWFLGGYAFYSTLFALAGSLVSRQEDAQAANAPIMTVLVAAYMTIFVFGWAPASTPARVLSLIPPFAPFSMPLRMAAGAASVLEIVVSLTLLVLSILAIWKLASRIYAQVLLRRGTRIPWTEALRTLRSAPTGG
ncbi:MAG: ABC transporter permease subunit [Acidimicrobiia bacterium]|nr:ABC transporter permease subunit [Acidimicrobiia bacterium]